MLVLSRYAGEKIVIGENITITVSRVLPGRVVIGIEAPSDMLVMRQELLEVEIGSEQKSSKPRRVGGHKSQKLRDTAKSGQANAGEATVADRVMARQSLRDFAKALLSGGSHSGTSAMSESPKPVSSDSALHGRELLDVSAVGSSETSLTPAAIGPGMIISEPMERCA